MIAYCSNKGRDERNKQLRCPYRVWKDDLCESHYKKKAEQRAIKSAQDKERYLRLSEDKRIQQQEHNELVRLREILEKPQSPRISSWIYDSVRLQQQSLCRGPGGNPYNATTTIEKMQAPGFDLHARLKGTGWIIIQGAFDPTKVDYIGIMDRVAIRGEGIFDEITNDDADVTNHSSQRKQIPAPTNNTTDGLLEKNVNSFARNIVDDAVRFFIHTYILSIYLSYLLLIRDLGLQPTYDLILALLRKGKGWENEYTAPETKILTANPVGGKPCPAQLAHYDYNLGGRRRNKNDAMPYSSLTAVNGDATSITLVLEVSEGKYQELVVPMLPGDMVLWGGEVLHCGRPYALPNMRVFAYFPTRKHQPEDQLLLENVDILKV